jgi:hypothetical protein
MGLTDLILLLRKTGQKLRFKRPNLEDCLAAKAKNELVDACHYLVYQGNGSQNMA